MAGDDGSSHQLIRRTISTALERAIHQICGGSDDFLYDKSSIRQMIGTSISFTNKVNPPKTKNASKNNCRSASSLEPTVDGKPHDIECRIALSLFHQWNRKEQQQIMESSQNDMTTTKSSITVISDMNVDRDVTSPKALAAILCPLLEEEFRLDRISPVTDHESDDPSSPSPSLLSPDVRTLPSGILCFWTVRRTQQLRRAGRVPCPNPNCVKWCKGENGLRWHQQQHHDIEYADSAASAAATSSAMVGAIIQYRDTSALTSKTNISYEMSSSHKEGNSWNEPNTEEVETELDPIECIKDGDIEGLKRCLAIDHMKKQKKLFDPSKYVDPKGATPLMWAAGGGHLRIVEYLIEEWGCDPRDPQRGKRSFAGRTALHWACRNGHLPVVKYLVKHLKSVEEGGTRDKGDVCCPLKDTLDAATQDGTTAFGWASWQRQLDIMDFLYHQGCNIHSVNSFGCNAVLWCAQGSDNSSGEYESVNGMLEIEPSFKLRKGLLALKWLQSKGCDMTLVNHNGHGVLHKCAQRGQRDVGEWFCGEFLRTECNLPADQCLRLVGPDVEGYCPSDLAGMEGHSEFATWLAGIEVRVCQMLQIAPEYEIPDGFAACALCGFEWEKYGGIRRMRQALSRRILQ